MPSETGRVIRNRFQRFMSPDRTPMGGPNSQEGFADNPAVVVDPAAVEPQTAKNITGFPSRVGVDGSGQPVVRRMGLPPVQQRGGFGDIPSNRLPKKHRFPIAPAQYTAFPMEAADGTPTTLVDKPIGFPCRGLVVDNYSNVWLYIAAAARYIPPLTVGVQFRIASAPTERLAVIREAPPGYTNPTALTGSKFSVFAYEVELEPSPGLPLAVSQLPAVASVPTASIVGASTGQLTATQAATNIAAGIVPANRTFTGSVTLAAAAANAIGAATGTLRAVVSWVPGTGGTAAQDVAVVELQIGATTASTTADEQNGTVTMPFVCAAGSTAGTFQVAITKTGTITALSVDACVNGQAQ